MQQSPIKDPSILNSDRDQVKEEDSARRALFKSQTFVLQVEADGPSKEFLIKEQAKKEAQELEKKIENEKLAEKKKQLLEIENRKRDDLLFKLDARAHDRLFVLETDKKSELDVVFVRDVVVPYLSDVYYSLEHLQGLGYIEENQIKFYLHLPEILGTRLMQLINANGDSTIDHDEWLEYMLQMICGNFERRLFIVFQMFDLNNDQVLKADNMKLLLKHLPIRLDHMHFGISHENDNDSHRSRIELQKERHADSNNIDQFVEIFFTDHHDGMVFNVFKKRIMTVSSEPFFAIISQFQEHIPCVQNFLRARSNFRKLAISNSKINITQKSQQIAWPSLIKSKLKLTSQTTKSQQQQPITMNKTNSIPVNITDKDQLVRKSVFKTQSDGNLAQYVEQSPLQERQKNLISNKAQVLIDKKTVIKEESDSVSASNRSETNKLQKNMTLTPTKLNETKTNNKKLEDLFPGKDIDIEAPIEILQSMLKQTNDIRSKTLVNIQGMDQPKNEMRRNSTISKLNKLHSLHKSFLSEKDMDKIDVDEKDFGLDISDLQGIFYEVVDEFQMPFKSLPARTSGPFIQKTKTGYYKSSWAIISGNEMYVYQNKESSKHINLLILSGARIYSDTRVEAMVEVKDNIKYSRLFEVRIKQCKLEFSLFFEKLQSVLEWKKALVDASGDFQLYDFYEMPDKIAIAEGNHSIMYKAIHKVHQIEVAVKKIPKEAVPDKTQIIREIDLMKLAVHQYTTRLLDHFQDDTHYYMVQELEKGGSLFNYLGARKNQVKEERARDICNRIAQAIEFMHDYGIIIGQLDLESVVMTDQTDSAVPRISKFNKARIMYPGSTIKDGQQVGKLLYWAPELCNEVPYDFKIDVWSFGAICYYLLSGQYHVIKRKDNANQKKEIVEKEFQSRPLEVRGVSISGIDLCRKCLQKEPNKRPTMKQVMQHQWFKTLLD